MATIGQMAAEILVEVVASKWKDFAVTRVSAWVPVLSLSYDAVAAGKPDTMVHVPSHIGEAGSFDTTAYDVLQDFDYWLGPGTVWSALEFVVQLDELTNNTP